MNKIEITQSSVAVVGPDKTANMAFARAVQIPVHRQFSNTPIEVVTVMAYSDEALTDAALAAEQALAGHFSIEERRPEDRSAPQLHMLFDGRAFGKPLIHEVGMETARALHCQAASNLVQEIRDFKRT